MHDTISTLVEQFWAGLGITLEKCETHVEGDDVSIRIETPDSALVIGMHGKSLESFTHILSRMIEKTTTAYVHVHLEVNDYVKSKEEKMFRFLDSKIALVMSTGRPVQVANLSSYDRKKAHGYIADKDMAGLSTHSEGEGDLRHLVMEYQGELKQSPHTVTPHTPATPGHTAVIDLAEDGIGI